MKKIVFYFMAFIGLCNVGMAQEKAYLVNFDVYTSLNKSDKLTEDQIASYSAMEKRPVTYQLFVDKNESKFVLNFEMPKASTTEKTLVVFSDPEDIYKNLSSKEMILKSRDSKAKITNRRTTNFDWKIGKETKKIIGFDVTKATVKTSDGRKIEAWFAKDIPFSNGPSKYNGLPGLILELKEEVNDEKGTIHHYISHEIKEINKEDNQFKTGF